MPYQEFILLLGVVIVTDVVRDPILSSDMTKIVCIRGGEPSL